MISVSKLHKRYGGRVAVSNLSFSVNRGEVVGFLGPNGAGKSTTLRILAGFLSPTSGTVRIAGHDVEQEPDAARLSIGYMPEGVPLYPEMRVAEYLRFRAELKGVPRRARALAVFDAMERAVVVDVANAPIGKLSKGYRQRVGLADALVASPPILILDEPTAGLDPNQIREVRGVLRDLARDRTVILSTHILAEVEASCSRAVVIAEGKLVAQGSLDELRASRRASSFEVTVRGSRESIDSALASSSEQKVIGLIEPVALGDRDCFVVTVNASSDSDVVEQVVAKLVGAGLGVRAAKPVATSLEEVFTTLTRGSREEQS